MAATLRTWPTRKRPARLRPPPWPPWPPPQQSNRTMGKERRLPPPPPTTPMLSTRWTRTRTRTTMRSRCSLRHLRRGACRATASSSGGRRTHSRARRRAERARAPKNLRRVSRSRNGCRRGGWPLRRADPAARATRRRPATPMPTAEVRRAIRLRRGRWLSCGISKRRPARRLRQRFGAWRSCSLGSARGAGAPRRRSRFASRPSGARTQSSRRACGRCKSRATVG
mmetsp:Transcript_29959/g.63874  ORF Transcript_29959/g.63874 Transcript_29959/m.63874 type:complete len:226 (+) Transcript_29959:447-1124(+)